MAPTVVAASSPVWSASGSVSPALPAGWAAGDLHIAPVLVRNSGQTIDEPAGWVSIAYDNAGALAFRVLARIAQPGDAAPTFTSSQTTTQPTGALVVGVRDWVGDLAELVVSVVQSGSVSTLTWSNTITLTAESLLLFLAGISDDNLVTADPDGATYTGGGTTTVGSDAALAVWSLADADGGTTPTYTASMSANDQWINFLVGVGPAVADPGESASLDLGGVALSAASAPDPVTGSAALSLGGVALVGAAAGTDLFSTDFDGETLPDGWTFDAPEGVGSLSVSGSRANITVPGGASRDSIFSTSSPDNSIGVTAAVPDHGGDVDIAVQVDTDVGDMLGQGINLLVKGAADDAARMTWFHNTTVDREEPQHYGYARAGGSGATLGAQTDITTYMTGIPAWLRIRYTASTGLWEALDSADGVSWNDRRSGTRSFTPASFKVAFTTSDGGASTGNTLRVQKAVDLLATGTADLRDPQPELYRVPVTVIDPAVDSSLPAGWVDDSAGTSSASFTGGVLRLEHDCTQDATDGAAGVRLRYTGGTYAQWGLLLKVSNPVGNSSAYFTPGAGLHDGIDWIDQYAVGPGYGLEVQSGQIRRPIRLDDPAGATVAPTPPYSTDLNEMPYCWLANYAGQYNMRDGGTRWFRLERTARRYRVREWADGDTEPATWDLFDGQDQVEDRALAPALSLSHNGIRTGTVTFDVHQLEFYELTADAPSVPGSAALPLGGVGLVAAGQVGGAASADALLGGVTLNVTGTVGRDAAVVLPLGGVEAVSAGGITASGTTTISLSGVALAGAGQVDHEAGVVLPVAGIVLGGAGDAVGDGSGAAAFAPGGVALSGPATRSASGAVSILLGGAVLGGTGSAAGAGSGAVVFPLAGVAVSAGAVRQGAAAAAVAPGGVALTVAGLSGDSGGAAVLLGGVAVQAEAVRGGDGAALIPLAGVALVGQGFVEGAAGASLALGGALLGVVVGQPVLGGWPPVVDGPYAAVVAVVEGPFTAAVVEVTE